MKKIKSFGKCTMSIILAVTMLLTCMMTGSTEQSETSAPDVSAQQSESVPSVTESASGEKHAPAVSEEAPAEAEQAAETSAEEPEEADEEEAPAETVSETAAAKKLPQASGSGDTRTVTIYYDNLNNSSWLHDIKIYAYYVTDGNVDVNMCGAFPGVDMIPYDDNRYYYTFDNAPATGDFYFVVVGYETQNNTEIQRQSVNQPVSDSYASDRIWSHSGSWSGEYVEYNGNWYKKWNCTSDQYTTPDIKTYTVYYDNYPRSGNTEWGSAYAYVWAGETKILGDFPGRQMTCVNSTAANESKIYMLTFNASCPPANILFSDNGDNAKRTPNFEFTNNKTYSYPVYGSGNYYIKYISASDGGYILGNTAITTPLFESADSKLYADISISDSEYTYFGLYDSNDTTHNIIQKNSVLVTDDDTVTASTQHWRDTGTGIEYNFGKISPSSTISKVRIVVDLDSNGNFSTYTVTASDDEFNLFAKDGTIRASYQKYADIANTVVAYTNGNSILKSSRENTCEERARVNGGEKITVTTTIDADYRNTYYVKAFCVNGVSYGVIDEPAVGDNRRNTGVYSFEYTIPDDFTYIEITPIYFYFETGGALSNLGFITFHVEKYTGSIQRQWGNTIACHAWYTSGFDEVNAGEDNKNALGGFPGQPLVFDDGDYYMQVPKKLPVNNNSSDTVTVQGMTLSNYYWDSVHMYLADKDPAFKGTSNSRGARYTNSQTYDFNDFAALAAAGADDIVFTFKYRSSVDNRDTPPQSTNVGYAAGVWNGWDGLVDYYNRAVDLSGRFITNTSGEPYTEEDLLKMYTTNSADVTAHPETYTDDAKLNPEDKIWIVSKGYQDIKRNDNNGYYGNYATTWDFYTYSGDTFTRLTYNNTAISLPGSSFIPPNGDYERLSSGLLPTYGDSTPSAKYANKTMYEANKAKYLSFSSSSGTDTYRDNTFDQFVYVYNATLGKATMIAYEQAICEGGDYNNPALRCDGRWYYSTSESGSVGANLSIEYKPSGDNTDFTPDTDYSGGTGSTTGATVRFTSPDNDDTTKVWKNASGVHATETYSKTEYFEFNADSYSANGGSLYRFVGWYVKNGSNYTPVNPSDLANVNGRYLRRITYDFIARYEQIDSSKVAIIDHQLLPKENSSVAKSGGSGKVYTTIEVLDENNEHVYTYPKTEGPVTIDARYLQSDSTYKFKVTLEYEPDAYSVYVGTYYDKSDTPSSIENDFTNTAQVYTKTYIKSDIDSLIDETTKTKVFYTDFSLNTLSVTYNYYDRATNANAAVDVNETATQTVLVNVPYSSGQTISEIIMSGLNQKINANGTMSKLSNILDKYYIWSTQTAAVAGIKGLPDYRASADGTVKYGDSGNTNNYDFTKHFNHIGQNAGDGEPWVSYVFNADKSLADVENDESKLTTEHVSAVTVWAFNTPELYTMRFIYPSDTVTDDGSTIASKMSDDVISGIYCIPEGDATTGYLTEVTTFYGQRIGVKDEESTDQTVNDPGLHISQYGIDHGYTGNTVIAKDSFTDGDNNTYTFCGWYDKATGAKVGSDRDYGYRVTTGMTLFAGYTKGDPETQIGASLTRNNEDYFFVAEENDTEITQWLRFNTEMNVYNSVDKNPNITDTAVVYVRLRVQGAGSGYTTEDAAKLLEKTNLVTLIREDITSNLAKMNDDNDETEPTLSPKYTQIRIDGTVVAIDYTFVYPNNNGADSLQLNIKNRGMYTTEFKMSEVATNAPYSAMLVFGGINVTNGETSSWTLCDNYISYIDVAKD